MSGTRATPSDLRVALAAARQKPVGFCVVASLVILSRRRVVFYCG
jgi:hypothetical protein